MQDAVAFGPPNAVKMPFVPSVFIPDTGDRVQTAIDSGQVRSE